MEPSPSFNVSLPSSTADEDWSRFTRHEISYPSFPPSFFHAFSFLSLLPLEKYYFTAEGRALAHSVHVMHSSRRNSKRDMQYIHTCVRRNIRCIHPDPGKHTFHTYTRGYALATSANACIYQSGVTLARDRGFGKTIHKWNAIVRITHKRAPPYRIFVIVYSCIKYVKENV